jgi:hypothetical protein
MAGAVPVLVADCCCDSRVGIRMAPEARGCSLVVGMDPKEIVRAAAAFRCDDGAPPRITCYTVVRCRPCVECGTARAADALREKRWWEGLGSG